MSAMKQSFDTSRIRNTIRLLGFYVDNLSISVDDFIQLVEDDTLPMLESVASNTSSPEDVLRALSRTGDSVLRMRVAANPSAPSDVLMSLASDEDWRVRRNVARNPSSSEEVLEKLADRDTLLLDELAADTGISAEKLLAFPEGLAQDELEALA